MKPYYWIALIYATHLLPAPPIAARHFGEIEDALSWLQRSSSDTDCAHRVEVLRIYGELQEAPKTDVPTYGS